MDDSKPEAKVRRATERKRGLELSGTNNADGTVEELTGTDIAQMNPGDVFAIETPGGGGYGVAESG
jgi:N-methylhydantoinase B/oxoprolinase/acetone carboxylase alpha subunit